MPKLVKMSATTPDTAVYLSAEDAFSDDRSAFLPLELFLANAHHFEAANVWLRSDQDINELTPLLKKVGAIALKFDTFMDGRSFSQSRLLREHLEFDGEIRAVGYFIQDQLHYLLRCGFDAFSVADDADEEAMRVSMRDFSESYQAACDVSEPLFRRRA